VTRWGPLQLVVTLLAGLALWAALAACCLLVGSTGTGWPTAAQFAERLPAVLLASLVGAALAAAGVVYQAILRNPLADPYLLGVSSGASLAVFLWALPFAGAAAPLVKELSQQAFAFAGALASVGAVFTLAQRRGRLEPVTLLLVGVIVNAINGALFLLLYHLNLTRDLTQSTGGPFRFLVGGIDTNLTAREVAAPAVIVAAGWVFLLAIAGQLNVALASEAEAEALGVRIHRLRWGGMIVASLVTAAAVSISGPIGFVGLVCPHLARLIVGRDPRRLLPVATALGAGLLSLADAVSRLLTAQRFTGTKLPVGVLTGLLGGPFFLLLLWQSRRRSAP
jgi:iron complex transport system permease protein